MAWSFDRVYLFFSIILVFSSFYFSRSVALSFFIFNSYFNFFISFSYSTNLSWSSLLTFSNIFAFLRLSYLVYLSILLSLINSSIFLVFGSRISNRLLSSSFTCVDSVIALLFYSFKLWTICFKLPFYVYNCFTLFWRSTIALT